MLGRRGRLGFWGLVVLLGLALGCQGETKSDPERGKQEYENLKKARNQEAEQIKKQQH
jgi:hypothetical protein